MSDFADVTVVSIDGRRGELAGAQRALVHSARQLPGSLALLLSPQRPADLLPGIRHVPIQELGYFDYSLFVLYALHRFVATDFALLVQDDGWVLDGQQWQSHYRDFDYIGAPTQFARIIDDNGARFVRGHDADFALVVAGTPLKVDLVMNGGFSWRSRRLLEAPAKLGLHFTVPPVDAVRGPPYQMEWTSNAHLEDAQLCLYLRTELEKARIRFAPLVVARQFAFEHLHPALHEGLDLMQVFGHHSKLRKLTSLDPLIVGYQENARFLSQVYGEKQIAQLYQQRGYRVELPG